MKKSNFKPAQRACLLEKCATRRELFKRVYFDLKETASHVEDLRWSVLWEYDDDFELRNEHTSAYWSKIEDALDGLHDAMDELKELFKVERRKLGRLAK